MKNPLLRLRKNLLFSTIHGVKGFSLSEMNTKRFLGRCREKSFSRPVVLKNFILIKSSV